MSFVKIFYDFLIFNAGIVDVALSRLDNGGHVVFIVHFVEYKHIMVFKLYFF